MNNKLKDEHMDDLFKAILTLENTEECYAFFEDLCTVLELKAMSQRMQVAKMLAKTGASTATISRVNRTLNYGSEGYSLVFDRMDKKAESDK